MEEMITLFQKRIIEFNNLKVEIPEQKHINLDLDIYSILNFELSQVNEREIREMINNHNKIPNRLYDRIYELIIQSRTPGNISHRELLDTFCIRLGIECDELPADLQCPICRGNSHTFVQGESRSLGHGKSELTLVDRGIWRCKTCGIQFEYFDNIDKSSGEIKPDKSNKYKRLDYFIEVIKKLQKKYNIQIHDVDMEVLTEYFKEIEAAWHKLFKTKSFIPYPYLFRKGLELLGNYDHFLKVWSLGRSDENIRKCDKNFEKICNYLNYEFIPTG